ncbi:hypothetical protein [Leifsonia sp. SIMBA_070]
MTAIRRLSLPIDESARSNPLDIWARRIATAAGVFIALPVMIAGVVALAR